MYKRVIIAGCRDYTNYDEAKKYIDFCLSELVKKYELIILSGGCRGADMLGEMYAEERNIKIERYTAQWGLYGKFAGPKRNREMAENCDYIICFWDGESRGTKSLIEIAEKLKRPLRIKIIKKTT